MDIKNEMVRRLKSDCETLLNVKIPKALDNISDEKGINTYRNLTKALADNIKLIEEYDQYGLVADTIKGYVKLPEGYTVVNVHDKENHHSLSKYFNNRLHLTPIQKKLMTLKSAEGLECLRGEGSTFGVLLSAINQASIKDDTKIVIITPFKGINNTLNDYVSTIIADYVSEHNKITNVDVSRDNTVIIFNNGSSIIILTTVSSNIEICYKPDLIYTASQCEYYDWKKIGDFVKKIYLDDMDNIITFSTIEDDKKYYDITTKEVKDLA